MRVGECARNLGIGAIGGQRLHDDLQFKLGTIASFAQNRGLILFVWGKIRPRQPNVTLANQPVQL